MQYTIAVAIDRCKQRLISATNSGWLGSLEKGTCARFLRPWRPAPSQVLARCLVRLLKYRCRCSTNFECSGAIVRCNVAFLLAGALMQDFASLCVCVNQRHVVCSCHVLHVGQRSRSSCTSDHGWKINANAFDVIDSFLGPICQIYLETEVDLPIHFEVSFLLTRRSIWVNIRLYEHERSVEHFGSADHWLDS